MAKLVKRKVNTVRSREENRREWWKKRGKVVKTSIAAKSLKRKLLMAKFMEENNLRFDCKKCIHGLTNSCVDKAEDGCPYFADEVNEIYGPAYKRGWKII